MLIELLFSDMVSILMTDILTLLSDLWLIPNQGKKLMLLLIKRAISLLEKRKLKITYAVTAESPFASIHWMQNER